MNDPRPISPRTLALPGRQPLFLSGALPPAPRLAIVGSRAARRERLELVPRALSAAGAAGLSLVSGGALGVDGAAHRAALAAGVPQVAVLPCAPDNPYPERHVPLFREIAGAAASGLLFCLAPGHAPCRGIFTGRNALVLGLARALLVVEAHERSGSHGTGRLALRRRLPVAAVLGSRGCDALIAAGARPLRGGPEEFSADLEAWLAELAGAPRGRSPPWPAELARLAEALRAAGAAGIDLEALPDGPGLHAELLAAQRLGLVVEVPPGVFRRSLPP